ncbi:family 10 glycosylhydrolase [Candidatus Sumerlaeota bacterium]|nr:family 10 glycosylhydrolase [Candidatus Sumerlaeota bacterium]
MTKPFLSLSLLALCVGLFADSTSATGEEVRSMWVSRFDGWAVSNQTTSKSKIDEIMSTLANNNFNTVFFQVRGQCETYYPSPNEPWPSTYGYASPGWNPLQYALDKAHEKGLEFHAYINTHVMCSGTGPGKSTSPEHIYNLHGPTATGNDNWLIHDENGAPVSDADGYAWMSPGHPEASLWTRQQIMYLLQNYAVDGLHFDRIRTPGNTYSHDPVTQARFEGEGNPDNVGWDDFMRRQITDDLRRIYGQAAMIRPATKISAAPFGIMYKDSTTQYQGTGTQAQKVWYQDGFRWLQEGVVDFMVPQIYWTVGSSHPYEKLLADWLSHSGGERFVVGGSTTNSGSRTVEQLLAEQQETRTQSAAGWCCFSYQSMTNYWDSLKTNRFVNKVALPTMPWKSAPTKGIITGFVTDADGKPLTDARVVLENDPLKNAAGTASYNHLTGADGFFAILNVPVGATHKLTFSKTGKMNIIKTAVAVSAGHVTQVNAQFSNATPVTRVIGTRDTDATAGIYTEILGNWGNTTAASTAEGAPISSRYCSNATIDNAHASVSFKPILAAEGIYNVYATIPYGTAIDCPNTNWTLSVTTPSTNGLAQAQATETVLASGTVAFVGTPESAPFVNKWGTVTSEVRLPAGTNTTLTFTRNDSAVGQNDRFTLSAVKFEAVGSVPVSMSDFSLE